jgi:phosphoserine phosphatase
MDPDEVPQELVRELSDGEKRLRSIYERRDALNEQAKIVRELRDDLHGKRKGILEQLRSIRDDRAAIIEEMKAARSRRDLYNERARALQGFKRKKDGAVKDPYEDMVVLQKDLDELEHRYQTSTLSMAKERELVSQIEAKSRKLKELRGQGEVFQVHRSELLSKEEEIVELRRLSDEEHKKVMELSGKLDLLQKELDSLSPSLDHLRSEADKRHQEYLELREQADSFHRKSLELREKVVALRGERDKLRRDARALVEDQNKTVKDALDDGNKLNEVADRAVELLLKKGKVSL